MRWLVLFLALLSPALAQAERRVALVLAAEDYRSLRPLANPVHDALAVQDLLGGLGFEVTVETDRDLRRMRRALQDFREDGAGADVALIFYAGHGVEIAGQNYLLPVDAKAGSAAEVEASSLPLAEVQAALADVAPVGIILLDACREDPFGTGALGQGRSAAPLQDAPAAAPRPGLGRIGRADGVLFAFSAAPGEVAADGTGADSPFTEALLRHFATPGVEVRTALTLVQQDVYDRSRGKQLPYVESGLPRLFFAATAGDLAERDRLLIAMADLSPALRAEVEALAQARDMPLAPLYGALLSADLAGKDQQARRQALIDSAEAFLRFRDELQRLSPDDPKVADLRRNAEAELSLGAYDQTRALLAEAARIDAEARETLRDSYRARTLSQAQTHALAATAARADLRYDLAAGDLARAIALYAELEGPDLPRADRAAFTDLLWDQGDLFRLVGNSGFALRAYRHWEEVAAARLAEAPDDPDWQRNHAVARVNIGDMLAARGDLPGALAEFRAALAVADTLGTRDDALLKWRHDRFVARSKIADVLQGQGDLAGALAMAQQGQAVLQDLVDATPGRDDLRRDLAVAQDRVGDLRRVEGDLTAALAAYQAALGVRQDLLAKAPQSTGWANELATSHDKIGDIRLLQGDGPQALAEFEAGAALVDRLAARDPGNAALRRDLSLARLKIGDAALALGDQPRAKAAYAEALALRQQLVTLDPENADWQRDVAVAQTRLGDLALKNHDLAAAAPLFDAALALSRQLAEADPARAERQQDLAASLDRRGDLAMLQGDPATAAARFGESYAIARHLARQDPGNAEYQLDLVSSLVRQSVFAADRRPLLTEALQILTGLQQAGRLDPAKAGWIAMVEAQMNLSPP